MSYRISLFSAQCKSKEVLCMLCLGGSVGIRSVHGIIKRVVESYESNLGERNQFLRVWLEVLFTYLAGL